MMVSQKLLLSVALVLLVAINMFKKSKKQLGFFLIEVVIASALAGGILISLLGLVQNTVDISKRSLEKTQAGYLLEEGSEALKTIRDAAWSNISSLSNGTTYYLSWNGSVWQTSTTPSMVDSFTRTVVLEAVSRDGSDDIVSSGGTYDDTRTRKATVTVTWEVQSGTQTESIVFYLADIRT